MCNHHKDFKNKRHGSALEHGEAHEKDHTQWSRRAFLANLGLAGGMSMLLGKTPLKAASSSPLSYALENTETDRILVLIQLKGGNDGLNTIIPLHDYDFYRNVRPSIGIKESDKINLNTVAAIPNYMADIHPLWEEGMMKVVRSVGYDNQNLSHFRSTDIWQSSSDANEYVDTGWLGRYLENEFPDFLFNPPDAPPAIQIGSHGDITFMADAMNMAVSVTEPEHLEEIAERGVLYDINGLPTNCYGDQLTYVRAITNNSFKYAKVLKEAYDNSNADTGYTEVTGIGNQLNIIARLIKGGLKTRLYMVTLDGFDTHADQVNAHPYLMEDLTKNIKVFFDDMATANLSHRVLAMTFSEFGRRIEQNGSNGTDHGSAAPVLLFGDGVDGSDILGMKPDLQNPDVFGNLTFDTDFRSVYATVLENWLCLDPTYVDNIIGNQFPRLSNLVLSCNSLPSNSEVYMDHHPLLGDNSIVIEYDLPYGSAVKIDLLAMNGQYIATLTNEYQFPGKKQVRFNPNRYGMVAGQYAYKIEAMGKVFSKLFPVVR